MSISNDSSIRRSARLIRLISQAAASPVTAGNLLQTYYSGKAKFDALLEDLASAQVYIHMEYYIWRSDNIGYKILNLLKEKSRAGVIVRLVFDGLGSFGKISYAYRRAMKKAGIQFVYFHDLSNPVSRLKINYRNHRKIAIIDGKIAYTGGMNIGSEYIDGGKNFSAWRDTHLRIQGPAVSILQAIFLIDWHNSGNELLLDESMFPDRHPYSHSSDGMMMQIAISGPDSNWELIRLHYLELLNGAREEVLIQTPYYIPGESIENAIIAAALRGVRVILMTVGNPDKKIPYWAGQSYMMPLLEAGVEIYRFRKGFLHSKVMIQDRIIASVGTCNVDMRSFSLDYEVNTVIYDREEAAAQAKKFTEDLSCCTRITLKNMENISGFKRLRNNVFRLLSPLM